MSSWDVIVVGLGAMGSASLRALARRGLRVIGFDRFDPPHDRGSSHGQSRIIREAYFEDPAYVPLVQRAYRLWEELGRESERPLLAPTGGLMVGPRDGALVTGALRSAEVHGLPHEILDAGAIQARFLAFRPRAEWVGVWEPNAGVLKPEAGIGALLEGAAKAGAVIRRSEPVDRWRAEGSRVAVTTARGAYHAGHVVLAAGAWLPRLLPDMPLRVTRQVMYWFETVGARQAHDAGLCPVSIWEYRPDLFFYSFPRDERGVKVAFHRQGVESDPDRLDREVRAEEVASVRGLLHEHMPFASGPLIASSVCMYTNTPDGHFVVDRHPEHSQAVIVSACSGHGFKFAPAIGEAVSDLIVEGWTRHDLGLFRAERLAR